MDLLSKLSVLTKVGIFQHLDAEELLLVAKTLEVESFQEGETLFKEGEAGSSLFLVAEGTVALFAGNPPQPLGVLNPGDFLGEMALFEEAPRSATAKAGSKLVVLTLSRAGLRSVIMERPQVSFSLLRTLSGRLRQTTQRLMQSEKTP